MMEISSLCNFKAHNDCIVIAINDLSSDWQLIDHNQLNLKLPDCDKSDVP